MRVCTPTQAHCCRCTHTHNRRRRHPGRSIVRRQCSQHTRAPCLLGSLYASSSRGQQPGTQSTDAFVNSWNPLAHIACTCSNKVWCACCEPALWPSGTGRQLQATPSSTKHWCCPLGPAASPCHAWQACGPYHDLAQWAMPQVRHMRVCKLPLDTAA